ncbi:hypothetical protein MBLNU230_g2944t1 [Neophaeotheca triangularis]
MVPSTPLETAQRRAAVRERFNTDDTDDTFAAQAARAIFDKIKEETEDELKNANNPKTQGTVPSTPLETAQRRAAVRERFNTDVTDDTDDTFAAQAARAIFGKINNETEALMKRLGAASKP